MSQFFASGGQSVGGLDKVMFGKVQAESGSE